jgi:hypothetical protein
MVRPALWSFTAVLLIAAFLNGAGVPMPPLSVVLVVAAATGWALRNKKSRYDDEDSEDPIPVTPPTIPEPDAPIPLHCPTCGQPMPRERDFSHHESKRVH